MQIIVLCSVLVGYIKLIKFCVEFNKRKNNFHELPSIHLINVFQKMGLINYELLSPLKSMLLNTIYFSI